jgi:hypothetical protein
VRSVGVGTWADESAARRRTRRMGGCLRRLRWVKYTLLPHARERMEEFSISPAAVLRVLQEPDEEGAANFGRLYAQKRIGHQTIRVIYNLGRDEAMVITVMLRRREGRRP